MRAWRRQLRVRLVMARGAEQRLGLQGQRLLQGCRLSGGSGGSCWRVRRRQGLCR